MSIHYLLKAGRRESGYTLREAAALLNMSSATLYRYEEGIVQMIPEEKARVLLAFYYPYLLRLSDRLKAQSLRLGWSRLSFLYPHVTAASLYSYFLSTDERGRRSILHLLRYQSIYGEKE